MHHIVCMNFASYQSFLLTFFHHYTLYFKTGPTLCDPMDCSLPHSSVYGILQARILEWVAIPFSKGSSQPRGQTTSLASPALAGGFFTTSTTREAKDRSLEINRRSLIMYS